VVPVVPGLTRPNLRRGSGSLFGLNEDVLMDEGRRCLQGSVDVESQTCLDPTNLDRAWRWILSNPDAAYKGLLPVPLRQLRCRERRVAAQPRRQAPSRRVRAWSVVQAASSEAVGSAPAIQGQTPLSAPGIRAPLCGSWQHLEPYPCCLAASVPSPEGVEAQRVALSNSMDFSNAAIASFQSLARY
jgi:hypothetical protein